MHVLPWKITWLLKSTDENNSWCLSNMYVLDIIMLTVIKTQFKEANATKGIYWLTVIEKTRNRCFRDGWIQELCNIIRINCLHHKPYIFWPLPTYLSKLAWHLTSPFLGSGHTRLPKGFKHAMLSQLQVLYSGDLPDTGFLPTGCRDWLLFCCCCCFSKCG